MDRWLSPVADYLHWLAAGGRSAGTVRIRRYQLWALARAFPDRCPWSLDTGDLARYLARDGWEPETRKSARGAIVGFYKWGAVVEGRVAESPASRLASVRVPPGKPRPAPEMVLAAALGDAPDRERLMLMLAAYAGLRRAEIAKVHSRDVVDGQLRVVGKGGKVRVVPLHPVLLRAVEARARGYLFPGKIDGHLSPQWVGKLLARHLGDGWTAHTLRHRFSTMAYAGERDLLAVQQLLGHASPTTTMIYTALPSDALSRAVLAAGPTIAA